MSGIRRYSLGEIEEMRRRGEVRVFADAREGPDFDEDDWEEAFAGEADAGPPGTDAVTVSLDREVVEAIQRERPEDWQRCIEQVLREHLARSRGAAETSRHSRRR
ncbi:hypothetical protein ACTZWW_17735 [Salinarimonas sp. NSM]|uniref:hypothetical protein n=1 Tax=Salinarimonas sp. NSM TaxID=3458003 RepID=UPI0040366826